VSEPVRHEASERNRRKALHNAECLLEELLYLHSESVKRETNLKYAIHRANTLVNRLKAEAAKDKSG
jgi:quinol monooxygenase YgiN